MKVILSPLRRLLFQFLLLLLLYFICRVVFTRINIEKFSGLSLQEYLRLAFYAIRYDISAIVSINVLYAFLLLLPFELNRHRWWETFTQWLFILTNAFAFAFEISDWAYFPFALKRSTIDVFDMIGRKGDFLNLLPHFLVDYWYAPVGFALLILLLYTLNKWICRKAPLLPSTQYRFNWQIAFGRLLVLTLTMGLFVIGLRGGLQLVPIGNGNALQVADNKYVPIVLNTPFSIMHSYSGKMEEVHFYPEEQLTKYFNPVKQYKGRSFNNKNIVFIILESFSKQFTGLGGRKSYTPFLDSLLPYSYVFSNAYANSLHSAEGIPAIISGVPSLMEEPITTSAYSTHKLTSLPSLLRDKGYSTAFYHGGTNGTMGFDIYAANAGFSKYYGRSEYNNEADYDGNWGIWDEPFLQYFAKGLSTMKQPFMASVFTLTSHDPFKIPEQYRDVLPKGNLKVQQSIAYTDLSLRRFFASIKKEPWFTNTLFVFVADHCSPMSTDKYYSSPNMGMYAIPVIFYAPGDSTMIGSNREVFQHMDILPTVLDYLGYKNPFFSFGNSGFSPAAPRFVINELSGRYQWYMNGYLLTANDTIPRALYHFQSDSMCRHNILPQQRAKAEREIIPYFKAFVQLYRSSVIRNRLSVDTWNNNR
jgi:phosphoglycerol transferase MdoB-like AlkP superfamily enzyme